MSYYNYYIELLSNDITKKHTSMKKATSNMLTPN